MQTPGYTTLTRLSGLAREMQVIANNIANAQTTGFRQQGMLFSEYIARTGTSDISMASGRIEQTSLSQGVLSQTGGAFDLAIEGPGFFQIGTPQGTRITRNGVFTPDANGTLMTVDGNPLLDAGGAPVLVPPGATDIAISEDGTISTEGRPVGQIALVTPVDPNKMVREGAMLFAAEGGTEPVLAPRIRQGFVERSNVDAVGQIARMIEVSRAYEMGQSFLDAEHDRQRDALKSLST